MIFWFGTTFWICRCNHISRSIDALNAMHSEWQLHAMWRSNMLAAILPSVKQKFTLLSTFGSITILARLCIIFRSGFFPPFLPYKSSAFNWYYVSRFANSIYTTCSSLLKEHSNLCRMMRQLNFTSMAMAIAMSSGKCFHCQNECSVSKSSLFIWCVDLNVRYPKFSQPLGVHLTDFAMYNCVCDAWDGCALLKMHRMR